MKSPGKVLVFFVFSLFLLFFFCVVLCCEFKADLLRVQKIERADEIWKNGQKRTDGINNISNVYLFRLEAISAVRVCYNINRFVLIRDLLPSLHFSGENSQFRLVGVSFIVFRQIKPMPINHCEGVR